MSDSSSAAVVQVSAPSPFAASDNHLDRAGELRMFLLEQLKLLGEYRIRALDTRDAESIHKLRVTTRRLQVAIDLMRPDRQVRLGPLNMQLRKLRRGLSSVRNYDVFIAVLKAGQYSKSKRLEPTVTMLESLFAERRERRFSKARKLLSDQRAFDREPIDIPGLGAVGTSSAFLDRRAVELIEWRVNRFSTLAVNNYNSSDHHRMHRLRITTKRLRYSLELLGRTGYGEFSRALEWLRALQDRLGDWHDLAALEDEIIRIAARRKFMESHLSDCAGMLSLVVSLRSRRRRLDRRVVPVKVPRLVTATQRQVSTACAQSSKVTESASTEAGVTGDLA